MHVGRVRPCAAAESILQVSICAFSDTLRTQALSSYLLHSRLEMASNKRSREQCSPEGGDNEHEWDLLNQGAEGKVWGLTLAGRPAVAKERFKKSYRHPALDAKLTKSRVLGEARCLVKARRAGLDTPALLLVDIERSRIYMERVEGVTVKAKLRELYSGGDYGAQGMELARYVT